MRTTEIRREVQLPLAEEGVRAYHYFTDIKADGSQADIMFYLERRGKGFLVGEVLAKKIEGKIKEHTAFEAVGPFSTYFSRVTRQHKAGERFGAEAGQAIRVRVRKS